jgi:ketosteroid isomerase-like protein
MRKGIALGSIGVFLVAASTFAQTGAVADVLKAEADWAAGRKTGKSAALVAGDYFRVTPPGGVFTTAPADASPNYWEKDCQAHVYGTAAVVTCLQGPSGPKNPVGATEDRGLRAWVKDGASWKVVLSHTVWAPATATPPAPLAGPKPAVTGKPYMPKNADETDVLRVNHALAEAFMKHDAAGYGRHTAPEFVRVVAGGRLASRDEFLKVAGNAADSRGGGIEEEMRVRIYGELAVLTWKNTGTNAQGQTAALTRMTRVFAKKNGAWQQVFTISSVIRPSA